MNVGNRQGYHPHIRRIERHPRQRLFASKQKEVGWRGVASLTVVVKNYPCGTCADVSDLSRITQTEMGTSTIVGSSADIIRHR